MASLIKKLAGETVIYGISHMLSRILFFVALTPYLSYKLNNDTSEYGVYSLGCTGQYDFCQAEIGKQACAIYGVQAF